MRRATNPSREPRTESGLPFYLKSDVRAFSDQIESFDPFFVVIADEFTVLELGEKIEDGLADKGAEPWVVDPLGGPDHGVHQ
jgi:hypothetical protein